MPPFDAAWRAKVASIHGFVYRPKRPFDGLRAFGPAPDQPLT